MRLTFWVGFWVFLADQLSKYLVVHWLGLMSAPDGRIAVLPPFIEFRMAWNKGVNFGLGASYDLRWVLVGVAIGISVFVLWWLNRDGGGRWLHASGGVLVGGAMGNVVDRVLYGAVADFLNVSCCGISNPYAFNVADIAVFAGAIGLILFTKDGNAKPRTRSGNKTP
jgi:signal peptidase II